MDFLEQYKKEGISSVQQQTQTTSGNVWIRLALKLSGGALKNEQQASYAILIFSILIILISIGIAFRAGNQKAPTVQDTINAPTPSFK